LGTKLTRGVWTPFRDTRKDTRKKKKREGLLQKREGRFAQEGVDWKEVTAKVSGDRGGIMETRCRGGKKKK